MNNEFPKKVFVQRAGISEGEYLSVFEDLEDFNHGDVVAVYELKEINTVSVKTTRRLIATTD